jgi:hypothetical protein
MLAEQMNARFEPLALRGHWNPRTTPHSERLAALADRLGSGSISPANS